MPGQNVDLKPTQGAKVRPPVITNRGAQIPGESFVDRVGPATILARGGGALALLVAAFFLLFALGISTGAQPAGVPQTPVLWFVGALFWGAIGIVGLRIKV